MIKLNRFIITNFKSLDKFEFVFSKFSCLIGLNSAGKSTILQAVDFISAQMSGDISSWLKERNWKKEELESKVSQYEYIYIIVGFYFNNQFSTWIFSFDINLKKCIKEEVRVILNKRDRRKDKIIFKVENSKYKIVQDDNKILEGDIIQEYEGSFLSSIKEELLPEVIIEFKKYIQNIYSLDLLSPKEIRKPSKDGSQLGLSGVNLSTFIKKLSATQQKEILRQLQECYPNIENFAIKTTGDGFNVLEVTEKFRNKKIINTAKYLNDGILRLIAILAQLQTKKSFLLFDEIENGMNAELIEFIMDTLIASPHQVMITTHSPMILNYIEDEVAKQSVHYIYKSKEGLTQIIPFFDIPSMSEKLEFMGAGSAYVDTNLDDLAEEIALIQTKEKK